MSTKVLSRDLLLYLVHIIISHIKATSTATIRDVPYIHLTKFAWENILKLNTLTNYAPTAYTALKLYITLV